MKETGMKRIVRLGGQLLILQILVWIHPSPVAAIQDRVSSDKGAEAPEIPLKMIAAMINTLRQNRIFEQRIASALLKMDKNLILERTRGRKDIEVYRKAAPAVVLVLTEDKMGSGAIIDREGHVITNWHVIDPSPFAVVFFKPKSGDEITRDLAFKAIVEKVDKQVDLALLRIISPPKRFAYLALAEMSSIEIGMDVQAIGHPEGEIWTYTKGIISQIRPNYVWSLGHRATVIQTQAPTNPGSSGGPLLNDDGQLIGINSFRLEGEGLNYAVAVDVVQEFLTKEPSSQSPQPRAPGAEDFRCPESYNSRGRGPDDLFGCYFGSTTPPPDLWAILAGQEKRVAYFAGGSNSRTTIDTVMRSEDLGENWAYYYDSNCDGVIDLLGYQRTGQAGPSSYRVPESQVRVTDMAWELDRALKMGRTPYSTLRVCQ
jgi:hypothetical protein